MTFPYILSLRVEAIYTFQIRKYKRRMSDTLHFTYATTVSIGSTEKVYHGSTQRPHATIGTMSPSDIAKTKLTLGSLN